MPSRMKCFKRFFKHTWHPQQMDSPSRFETAKTVVAGFNADETELGEVKITATTTTTTTPAVTTSNSIEATAGSQPCGNGGCRTSRNLTQPRHESPWHRLKTIFLVSVIAALIVWVIAYTLLSRYQIV